MKMKDFKNATKKQKFILLGVAISLGVIVLGIGLGVGLSETIDSREFFTKIDKSTKLEGTYWETSNEDDPLDSSKQLKTLRIKKEITSEAQLDEAYTDILSKGVDITYFNELLLPYHFKDVAKATVKSKLHLTNVAEDQIGYIFNKSDYVATNRFRNKNIVELNLPETVTATLEDQFRQNRIRKVNWKELTKLTQIGVASFYNNYLNGDLDLSSLKEALKINQYAFAANNINGTLTLPPNITNIENFAFNVEANPTPPRLNKISGTLKLPKTLRLIGRKSFIENNIEAIDWREADELVWIYNFAFFKNKIKTLTFNATVLPKLELIADHAFAENPGLNKNGEMFIEDFTLPASLQKVEEDAIKVKDGITVTAPLAKGISQSSFDGSPTIINPTT